jgi:hypothetical protein
MAAAEQLNFSQRLVMKGALIQDTYRVFQSWDLEASRAENMQLLRESNPTGSVTSAWLVELSKTLSSRFASGDEIAPLVALAQDGYPIDRWQFLLLWHQGSTDGLFSVFSADYLYQKRLDTVEILTSGDVLPFLDDLKSRGSVNASVTDKSLKRVASDLLRMARAFGLVEGKVRNRFTNCPIPEDAILYAVYSLMDQVPSVNRMIPSERWRLFLMGPEDVERELLNLHQFHRLRYEAAGTVRELDLPFANLTEFVQSLIA